MLNWRSSRSRRQRKRAPRSAQKSMRKVLVNCVLRLVNICSCFCTKIIGVLQDVILSGVFFIKINTVYYAFPCFGVTVITGRNLRKPARILTMKVGMFEPKRRLTQCGDKLSGSMWFGLYDKTYSFWSFATLFSGSRRAIPSAALFR